MRPAYQPSSEPDYFQDEEEFSYQEPPVGIIEDAHLARLGMLVGFTPHDLEMNRQGMLSPAQIEFLSREMRKGFGVVIGILTVLAFVAGLIGSAAIGSLCALTPMLGFMGMALAATFLMRREVDALPNQPVVPAEFKLGRFAAILRNWGLTGKQNGMASFRIANGKNLQANVAINRVLQANRTYCAYYAPQRFSSGHYRMLSIEPLGPEPADRTTWYEKTKREKKKKRF